MALKTIITGYREVESILPADVLDLAQLAADGGRVVEEFTVEVQRAKFETDHLVRFSVPADKFPGTRTTYVDGAWAHEAVDPKDYEITAEVEDEG